MDASLPPGVPVTHTHTPQELDVCPLFPSKAVDGRTYVQPDAAAGPPFSERLYAAPPSQPLKVVSGRPDGTYVPDGRVQTVQRLQISSDL